MREGAGVRVPGRLVIAALLAVVGLVGPWTPASPAQAAAPTLTDDAAGASLFGGGVLWSPGVTRSACLVVSVSGAAPGDEVHFGVQDVSGALAAQLTATVRLGSGGHHGDCTGFAGAVVASGTLAALGAAGPTATTTAWDPSSVASRVFRIDVTLDPASNLMGASAGASFVWTLMGADPAPATSTTTSTSTSTTTSTTSSTTTTTTTTSTTGSTTSAPTSTAAPTTTTPPTTHPAGPPVVTETSAPDPTSVPTSAPTVAPTSAPTARPSARPSPRTSLVVPATGDRPPAAAGGPGPLARVGAALRHLVDGLLHATFGDRAPQVAATATEVVRRPAFSLTPLVVAMLFLLTQHLVDLRDPKLALAARTRREELLRFPRRYRRVADDVLGSSPGGSSRGGS